MADRNFTLLELHVQNPKLDLNPTMPRMSLFGSRGTSSEQPSSEQPSSEQAGEKTGQQPSGDSSSSGRSKTMRVMMAIVLLAGIAMAVRRMRSGSKQTEIDEYEPVDTDFETADFEA